MLEQVQGMLQAAMSDIEEAQTVADTEIYDEFEVAEQAMAGQLEQAQKAQDNALEQIEAALSLVEDIFADGAEAVSDDTEFA